MICLCSKLECPYWVEGKGKPYGCSRYESALHCAGAYIKDVSATEDGLYIDEGKINPHRENLMKFAIQDAQQIESEPWDANVH